MELSWLCSSFLFLVPLPQHGHLGLHLSLIDLKLNLVDLLLLDLPTSAARSTLATAMRLSIISIRLHDVFHLLLESIAALEDLRDKECCQVFVVMEITDNLVDQFGWCVIWF